ncbi:3753_t:CDS:2, partial [Gigaspora margarita]
MPIIEPSSFQQLKVTYTFTKSALQDLVNLLDPIFGANNNQKELVLTQEEINIEFE